MSVIHDAAPGELAEDADAALRQLYTRYAKALHRYVERFGPDLASADDIVQETFIRAWRHLPQLAADDQLVRPWLYRVARNLLIDPTGGPGRDRSRWRLAPTWTSAPMTSWTRSWTGNSWPTPCRICPRAPDGAGGDLLPRRYHGDDRAPARDTARHGQVPAALCPGRAPPAAARPGAAAAPPSRSLTTGQLPGGRSPRPARGWQPASRVAAGPRVIAVLLLAAGTRTRPGVALRWRRPGTPGRRPGWSSRGRRGRAEPRTAHARESRRRWARGGMAHWGRLRTASRRVRLSLPRRDHRTATAASGSGRPWPSWPPSAGSRRPARFPEPRAPAAAIRTLGVTDVSPRPRPSADEKHLLSVLVVERGALAVSLRRRCRPS